MPNMSPLLVGFLGILGGGVIVAFCHGIIVLCNDRQRQLLQQQQRRSNRNTTIIDYPRQGEEEEAAGRQHVVVSSSLEHHRTVHVMVQSKGSKEEVCAVCLGELREGEGVRVLRECSHVFHVSCIDRWLGIHPNCPLCRATAAVPPCEPSPAAAMSGTPPPEFGGNVV